MFQVMQVNSLKKMATQERNVVVNPPLERLLRSHADVFKKEFLEGLPPKGPVDHEIKLESDSRPPHRPHFQLSPADLKAAKEYV